MNLPAQIPRRLVLQKLRPPGVALPLDQSPAGGHQEGKAHVGRRAIEDARGVAHRNPPLGRRVQIDVVDADAEVADGFHARHPVEQGTVDNGMAVGVDGGDRLGSRFAGGRPGQQFHAPINELQNIIADGQISQHTRTGGIRGKGHRQISG